MKFYVRAGERNQGPFGLDELRQRGLRPEEFVWSEGMVDWRPAAEVAELAPILRTAGAMPGPLPGFGGSPPTVSAGAGGASPSPYSPPRDYMDYAAPGQPPGPPRHSGLGIAATILGVGAMALMAGCFVVFASVGPDNPKLRDNPPPALVAAALAMCCGGPLLQVVGLILGLAGVFQPDRHKLFGIIGSVLNALALLGILALGLIALAVGAAMQ